MVNEVINRLEKRINHRQIDGYAKKVCDKLERSGYKSYLVGGCVRDMMASQEPKDFDVATEATADQTIKLFRGALRIGRRFPIVHVRFERQFIEVTTLQKEPVSLWRRLFGQVKPSSLMEDAVRRDFTVNALYYSLAEKVCHDPLNGIEDIEKKIIRSIGDADLRVQEDPIRMLRALRLAAKLDFTIEPSLKAAIHEHKELLLTGSAQRLFQEMVKILLSGCAVSSWQLMKEHGMLDLLCPSLTHHKMASYHANGLRNSDERIQSGRQVSLVYALAMLYWPAFSFAVGRMPFKVKNDWMKILQGVMEPIQVPLKIKEGIIQLYDMQFRMQYPRADDLPTLVKSPRFKAAFDFFMMRAATDSGFYQIASWWSDFFKAEDWVQACMINERAMAERRRAARPMRPRKGSRPHQRSHKKTRPQKT